MILLLSQLALADVIRSVPMDCPPGSSESMNHTGTWCQPDPACTEACPTEGETCTPEVGLCVQTTTERCGGRASFDQECTWDKTQALGVCASDADCMSGSCLRASRCLTGDEGAQVSPGTRSLPAALKDGPVTPDAPEPKRCSTTGVASSGLGLLLLLLAGLTRRR